MPSNCSYACLDALGFNLGKHVNLSPPPSPPPLPTAPHSPSPPLPDTDAQAARGLTTPSYGSACCSPFSRCSETDILPLGLFAPFSLLVAVAILVFVAVRFSNMEPAFGLVALGQCARDHRVRLPHRRGAASAAAHPGSLAATLSPTTPRCGRTPTMRTCASSSRTVAAAPQRCARRGPQGGQPHVGGAR